jgi:hypothetical protein
MSGSATVAIDGINSIPETARPRVTRLLGQHRRSPAVKDATPENAAEGVLLLRCSWYEGVTAGDWLRGYETVRWLGFVGDKFVSCNARRQDTLDDLISWGLEA